MTPVKTINQKTVDREPNQKGKTVSKYSDTGKCVMGIHPKTDQITSPHSYTPTRYGELTQGRNKHETLQPHPQQKLPKSEGKRLPDQT